MELLTQDQVLIKPNNIVYKNSPIWAFVAFLVVTGFLTTPIVLWILDRLPLDFAIVSGLFIPLFSIIYFKSYLKTLKPENWVVSLAEDHLLIKFRSFENSHLPKKEAQIVRIEYREIASFYIDSRTRITPSASGGTRHEFIKYLDLHLNSDTSELKDQLHYERNTKRTSKSLHYYVFVKGKYKIRIHWLDTQSAITPNLKHIANALLTKGLYQTQDNLDDKKVTKIFDEDKDILELYDSGHHIEAISLARRFYGINLAEAKSYVEKITNTHKRR